MKQLKNFIKQKEDENDEDLDCIKGRNLKRQGTHIYFYDYIDDISQLWLQQAMQTAYEEMIINNAKEMMMRGGAPDNIYIHINSPGGSVVSSLAIYDFIKNFPVVVVGIVEGQAASGASIMFCGCQLREMTQNSTVLVHELRTWDPSVRKWSEFKDDFENNKFFMKKLKSIYLKETSIPEDTIDNILSHDILWDVDECIKYELCDFVVGNELTESDANRLDSRVNKRLGNEERPKKKSIKKVKKN